MKVSLIIPTRNEAGAISQVLEEIPKNIINEIIVIDGHSTDKTEIEVRRQLRPKKDKFILQKTKGFGNALLQAFTIAKGDVIIVMNADGSHNPKELPLLIQRMKEGNEYVMGSRYLKGGRSDDDTMFRFLGNKIFTFIINFINKSHVTDSLYFYTAMDRRKISKLDLTSPSFELCVEVLVKAHRAGLKFAEFPAVERRRLAGKSKVNALRDGWRILKTILFI